MSNPKSTHLHAPSHRFDLFVVGELNMDLILDQVQAMPELEKERIAKGMTLTLGSSSAIMAANAAALGLKTAFCGRIGADLYGSQCIESLSARGVDTSSILKSDSDQTGLTCIFTYGRKRGMITYPGAMESLVFDDIPLQRLSESRHLHLSSFYLQTGLRPDVAKLFKTAKSMGLTTSFDTNWDPSEQWDDDIYDILPHVDVFLPNDDEAKQISKKDNLDDALDFLSAFGCDVVATCGAKGIVAKSGSRTVLLSGLPVTAIDAVGAGDTFNSGFLSSFLRGGSLEENLRMGILCSAFSTLYPGGTAAFDHLDAFSEFKRLYEPTLRNKDHQSILT